MNNIVRVPYPKSPESLLVYCDDTWINTLGPLMVVFKNCDNKFVSYPLSWLDENDIKFQSIQRKISSSPSPIYIYPIGELFIEDEKYKLKMFTYNT